MPSGPEWRSKTARSRDESESGPEHTIRAVTAHKSS